MKKRRIGIYAGTFDPVHAGHIAFALQAAKAAGLSTVYLAPERHPRRKQQVTHYAHRVAMIRRAIRPFRQLQVLELEDKTFSVLHTLPRLEGQFAHTSFVFVCGSDVVKHMSEWPHIGRFFEVFELCIGLRGDEQSATLDALLSELPAQPRGRIYVRSHASAVTSSQVREALRENRGVRGLLASVREYAAREWLYL